MTDVDYINCTACHIVPFSRPDVSTLHFNLAALHSSSTRSERLSDRNQVYQILLNINREPPLFSASVGLLLRDDLHHAFDRLEFSLYRKVSHQGAACATYWRYFHRLNLT